MVTRLRDGWMFLLGIVLCFAILKVEGVKREDFKACAQSGFCRRNRAIADEAASSSSWTSPFELVSKTLTVKDNAVSGYIKNTKSSSLLTFEVQVLQNGVARIRINENEPIKPRYEQTAEWTLVSNLPAKTEAKIIKKSDNEAVIPMQVPGVESASMVIHAKPLRIDFLVNDTPVLTLNERGLLNLEELRRKDEPKLVDQSDSSESKVETGEWEETFKTWTDPKPNGPESVALDVTFPGFSHVYGIPEHASTFSLKETRGGENAHSDPYRLYNLDVFEYETDNPMALYGSVPFMVAHNPEHSVGLFWMNAAETWIDIVKTTETEGFHLFKHKGKTSTTQTHWISEAGIIDVFVMLGPTPKDVLKQYISLTGAPAMPPAFSIAAHQCRWNYLSSKDVAMVDAGFDEHDIPNDVIWLDIEHTDGKKYFTWDYAKFPDPEKMQNELAAKGRKLVTIIDPHIKRDDGYYIYKEARDANLFIKTPDGNDYDGWCWPGSSSWIDYTNPLAREWWIKKFKFDDYKSSTPALHVWNDMNEPSVFNGPEITAPKEMIHHGGWEHRVLHNVYGQIYHGATAKAVSVREETPKRSFVLSRAFFAGTQRYGAIWTGDNTASWEHLRNSNPMLLSIGLAGIPFNGADVGGFFGNPSTELLLRWYQAGIFQPFFRAHAHIDTKRREPWLFGEPWTTRFRNALVERYKLLPYFYTLFHEAHALGVPVMRPMFFEFPQDERTFALEDQFMVGPALLVKPVVNEGQTVQSIYLPSGPNGSQIWYDYFTQKKVTLPSSGQEIKTTVGIEDIPVYLRGGSIVARRDRQRRSSYGMVYDPFTLIVALDEEGNAEGELYLDDGETFDYEKGAYIHHRFTFKNNRLTTQLLNTEPIAEDYASVMHKVRIERVVILGSKQDNGKLSKVVVHDPKGVTFDAGYKISKSKIVVRDPKLSIVESQWRLELKYQ
ncbi:hypothetical protein BZG36_00191 [Bifiguratus adelaidae]|uniref:Glucosidase II subunit alpha n=1 Tax=Bifiguratus adelaidae TaxID=1938954 RepID=A0A261Y8Q6_9FUNG|nr:hypothetical protein BZG36_00191 [Bifiguratus adelaidae]